MTKKSSKISVFELEHLGEMLAEPDEQHEWIVEDLFIKSGISMCAGKPKAGKTTLARQLALCVATGKPFLNFKTLQGPVVYLALEEIRSEVKKHFREMGATGDEQIFIHAAPAPMISQNLLIEQLEQLIRDFKPVLIIIDPLFRFTRVRDSNDYSTVTNALEGVVRAARFSNAHIHLVHHMGKAEREGADGILGSTAIFGGLDNVLIITRNGNERSIRSRTRYGKDLESVSLLFDEETRSMTLGGSVQSGSNARLEQEVLALLNASGSSRTQSEIVKSISGRKEAVLSALASLVAKGSIQKTGSGKRNSSFSYSVFVPHLGVGTETSNFRDGADTQLVTGGKAEDVI